MGRRKFDASWIYDEDGSYLKLTIHGKDYKYAEVSPYIFGKFVKKVRKNIGKGMTFIRPFLV